MTTRKDIQKDVALELYNGIHEHIRTLHSVKAELESGARAAVALPRLEAFEAALEKALDAGRLAQVEIAIIAEPFVSARWREDMDGLNSHVDRLKSANASVESDVEARGWRP